MAYISQRGKYWRAEIRRKGLKPVYRTFDTQKQAAQWARQIEAEIDAGTFVDKTEAEKTTLCQALERYLRDVVPEKLSGAQDKQRIKCWLRHPLAYKSLASLRGADFARYRDQRRNDGVADATIRHELVIVGRVFELARKEWGMEGLTNPIKNIQMPGGSQPRDRRLLEGEYDKIRAGLSQSKNKFVVHAFDFAIETSLRKNTLFKLKWEWVDLDARVVRVPVDYRSTPNKKQRTAANKGVPTVLPLSSKAVSVLHALCAKDAEGNVLIPSSGPIFNTTPNAVHCVWKRTLATLEIKGLRWHDLRHEAASRLFEKGLHPFEVAAITGHRSMQMLKRYTHLKPESLIAKLG